ncbi:MAG: glutamate 5-kinase [Candidatus Omnitrophica bacterium]|nr:glutamate 5-kinase [Candidatus Omnitrophota bacterium]MCM8792882.1 glutamate 5-kinase [Candidatus Omnitrophota bacterium]
MRKEIISKVRNLVIKVGTSVLATNSVIDSTKVEKISEEINALLDRGIKVCLVSSGAISSGMSILGMKRRPKNLPELQATAAVGQRYLMDLYAHAFQKYNRMVAQVLLTQEDLRERKRYLNARNTIYTLLKEGIIPIVNENDTVAVEEIKFGDNDRLSALVASLLNTELLILLSDVDGFFIREDVVSLIKEITPELERWACGTRNRELCVGGMSTKLEAAKICLRAGIPCIIGNGNQPRILDKIMNGEEIGTLFLPQEKKLSSRKQWMLFNLSPKGKIYIDRGAKEAILKKGKSLLSAGIVKIEGDFSEADLVSILDGETKREIGQGITNYSSEELSKIKGLKTSEIEKVLGYKYYDEVIHRDNLVIL